MKPLFGGFSNGDVPRRWCNLMMTGFAMAVFWRWRCIAPTAQYDVGWFF
jgi:hypothetical protein